MTSVQITVVQRERDPAECLPRVLEAAGIGFRTIHAVCATEVGPLSANEIVVLDVAPDRWGLEAAIQLRISQPGFAGPIAVCSFEREAELKLLPEGDILTTPGVTFIRLPVLPPDHFITILSALERPNAVEVSSAASHLWRSRIAARAKTLTHQRSRIGALRTQLKPLQNITSSARHDFKDTFLSCVAGTGPLTDWAACCDTLLSEMSGESATLSESGGISLKVQELVRQLHLAAQNVDYNTASVASVCQRLLILLDSIDVASGALEEIHTSDK